MGQPEEIRRVLGRSLAVVAVAVMLATACGGDDTGDDDAATGGESSETVTTADSEEGTTATTAQSTETGAEVVDTCSLLTDAEASEFLGVEVTAELEGAPSGAYGACEWVVPAEGFYRARLTVGPADHYEILRSNEATDLAGLGDEAWSHQYGDSNDILDIGVRTGEYHVLLFLDPMADHATGEAMMRQILEGLDA